MALKNNPSSLFISSLQVFSKALLLEWKDAYYTDYNGFANEFKYNFSLSIPPTIYNQVFDFVIEAHARYIQCESSDSDPNVPALIDSIIVPSLHKLNLNCLRHMGIVKDEEIRYIENILINELPNLNNLVQISLQTSGRDSTLPICNDEILEKIGSSCPKLSDLDVSYNHTVTDIGLQYLVPSETQEGCPLLIKLSLFECSVTPEGIAMVLEGLSWLKFLGYRETGLSLLVINKTAQSDAVKQLRLAHVNNLGISSRTCKNLHQLKCNKKLISVLSKFCPKLNGLKIRVDDSEVKSLQELTDVSILELVFNLGVPSSPGSNTIHYLQLCGTQFVSLSFMCETFTTHNLKVVCEQCNNMKRFWIRCNEFKCDKDITLSDKKKCALTNLEVFYFRIGSLGFELCNIPYSVLHYILHKSCVLTEIVLAMRNMLLCDEYIQELFSSITTSRIKQIMILVPFKNVTVSSVNLSMMSAETLISLCPQLRQLGNLLVWDVSLEEIQELRRQLKLSNSALTVIYKMAYS